MSGYLILGLGISNLGAVKLLTKLQKKIFIWDDNLELTKLVHKKYPGTIVFDDSYEPEIKFVVLSPGIKSHKFLYDSKIKLNEVDLLFKFNKIRQAIGCTGSFNKTTSVLNISQIMNLHYEKLYISEKEKRKDTKLKETSEKKNNPDKIIHCGNIGISCSSIESDNVIVELSSYQLETIKNAHFDLGIITNIKPHHFDRYDNLKDYRNAKFNLMNMSKKVLLDYELLSDAKQFLKPNLTQDLHSNVKLSKLSKHYESNKPMNQNESTNSKEMLHKVPEILTMSCSETDADFCFKMGKIYENGQEVLQINSSNDSNEINADINTNKNVNYTSESTNITDINLCTYAACRILGLSPNFILDSFAKLNPLEHRREKLAHKSKFIGEIINDSKSTNLICSRHIIKGYTNIIWIAGGKLTRDLKSLHQNQLSINQLSADLHGTDSRKHKEKAEFSEGILSNTETEQAGFSIETFPFKNIKKAYFFGENSSLMHEIFKNEINCEIKKDLNEIFTNIKEIVENQKIAKQQNCENSKINIKKEKQTSLDKINIIFSPGAPSQDMYKNFEQRGRHFKDIFSGF
ncbi:Mur ligase family protein [Candidatus Nesciobacter abundans]|uniref:Mur ligase central domain-containing protein n=1 Tax=Candidatus Nesciobacter abundans TaxID=2601668 RepID=A0A5C0UGP5_9PROT|nr:Mur ligase family protein [Candidatus Nesciobacter abundans]QEK39248.1 hypothetical protein FZC36_02330 [Candidatus Nesciobacter abundans]